MTTVILEWRDYRHLPYELALARRELRTLFGTEGCEVEGGIQLELNGHDPNLLRRLTYFRKASLNGELVIPYQTALEASVTGSKRQSTRYSAHGLHEYKGKFNPQIVRAIGNTLGIEEGDWVLDPFCGSGTTLVESVHCGWHGIGTDMNPLGVLISNAKLAGVFSSPAELETSARMLCQHLEELSGTLDFAQSWSGETTIAVAGPGWHSQLPDYSYLAEWFPRPVLAQAVAVMSQIKRVAPSHQLIFTALLSDLLRDVSLQEPADLRIRRRKDSQPNYPLIPALVKTIRSRIPLITQARTILGQPELHSEAFHHDCRRSLRWLHKDLERFGFEGFDAGVCSPPYATALPYIDTQRLSLCLLRLATATELRKLERDLIGTREITQGRRNELEFRLAHSANELPGSVITLLRRMLQLTESSSDGFRRRNMPALVLQYFEDMQKAFKNVLSVMKKGKPFALVVGPNRTTLGGEEVVVDTPGLLAEVACAEGWKLIDDITLETYQRYGLHHENSIKTERLLILESPS